MPSPFPVGQCPMSQKLDDKCHLRLSEKSGFVAAQRFGLSPIRVVAKRQPPLKPHVGSSLAGPLALRGPLKGGHPVRRTKGQRRGTLFCFFPPPIEKCSRQSTGFVGAPPHPRLGVHDTHSQPETQRHP